MCRVVDLSGARGDNAGLISMPVEALPPGCRGATCPAFALCQARCETRRAERETPGYPHGVTA